MVTLKLYLLMNDLRGIQMKLYKYNTSHSEKLLPPIIPHTFLTLVYHSGMRAKRLQNLAGHGDIQTTLGILEDRDVSNDNSATERAIRPFATGTSLIPSTAHSPVLFLQSGGNG